MEQINTFLRIIEILMDESVTVDEIALRLNLSISEIWSYLVSFFEDGIYRKFDIGIYYKNRLIYNISEPKKSKSLDKFYDKVRKYRVVLKYSYSEVDNINSFSKQQLWTIYDLLNTCSDNFISFFREKFNNDYSSMFLKQYKVLNSHRIIKKQLNIFNDLDPDKIVKLYNVIESKCTVDIKLDNDLNIFGASPICVYFDEDTYKWYLQYAKKKKIHLIKISRIIGIKQSIHPYFYVKPLKHQWGWGNYVNVKFKFYDEQNSKDSLNRYVIRKNILYTKEMGNYKEVYLSVNDINIFKRWVREMGAQVVIIKPEWLKYEILNEVKSICNYYSK